MIVRDFDIGRPRRRPSKANAKLIVYADAVLSGPISAQQFQPIAWRDSQVLQCSGDLQLSEFAPRDRRDAHKPLDPISLGQSFGIGILERDDHSYDNNAVRDGYQISPRLRGELFRSIP